MEEEISYYNSKAETTITNKYKSGILYNTHEEANKKTLQFAKEIIDGKIEGLSIGKIR